MEKNETNFLYHIDDFEEFVTENPSGLFCLSESTVQIVITAIERAGLATNWRVNNSDSGDRVSGSNFDLAREFAALAAWEVFNDMSCDLKGSLDSINETLQALLEAQTGEGGLTAQVGLINANLEANLGSLVNLESLTSLGSTLVDGMEAIDITSNCSPDLTVNCGGGASTCYGGGVGTPSDNTITDRDPAPGLGNPAEDPPPEGFDTWEEYNAYKCKAAQYLFDATEQWFRIVSLADSAGLGSLTAGGVAAWLLSQFEAYYLAYVSSLGVAGSIAAGDIVIGGGVLALTPLWMQAAIVAAIAGIVVLVGLGVLSLFNSVADEFLALRDETICALFDAQDVGEARGILSGAWADAIASLTIPPPYSAIESEIVSVLSTCIGYILTNSFMNQLFEQSDVVNKYDASNICGSCGGYWTLYDNTEEITAVSPGVWEVEGVSGVCGNGDYAAAAVRYGPSGALPGSWTIEVTSGALSVPNSTGGTCNKIWRGLYCGSTPVIENTNTTPTWPVVCNDFCVRSSTPFTLRITITGEGNEEC